MNAARFADEPELVPTVSDSSVAALAAVVFGDGVDEVLAGEIGPEFWDDVHFGVADLPKEKIRDPHFAGGANEEIGVGPVAGIKEAGEDLGVDGAGFYFSGGNLSGQALDSVDDLGASTIINGKDGGQLLVFGGSGNGVIKLVLAFAG